MSKSDLGITNPVPLGQGLDERSINFKLILFDALLFPSMLWIYLTVNAAGGRILIPKLATKLHKTWLISVLGLSGKRFAHELDLAPLFAFFVLVMVFLATTASLKIVCFGVSEKHLNAGFHAAFTYAAAIALVLFDGVLFFKGLQEQSFFTDSSFLPFLATIGYSFALLYASYWHVLLKEGDAQ